MPTWQPVHHLASGGSSTGRGGATTLLGPTSQQQTTHLLTVVKVKHYYQQQSIDGTILFYTPSSLSQCITMIVWCLQHEVVSLQFASVKSSGYCSLCHNCGGSSNTQQQQRQQQHHHHEPGPPGSHWALTSGNIYIASHGNMMSPTYIASQWNIRLHRFLTSVLQ